MSIGSKIKDLCADRDISLKKLAEDVGVARSTIYGYGNEIAIPNAVILHDIATHFGVEMEYFFDE